MLQDDFFQYMRSAGYTDVERGERGSSEEHLTVTQFKVEQEQKRLTALESKVEKKKKVVEKYEQKLETQKIAAASFQEIDDMGKNVFGQIIISPKEIDHLKTLAKESVISRATIASLERDLEQARRTAGIWKSRYEKLHEQTKDFMAALGRAPRKVKEFIRRMLHAEPEVQEQRHDRHISRNRGMER